MKLKIYAPLMDVESVINGYKKEIYVTLTPQPQAREKYIEFEVDLTQFKVISMGSMYQMMLREGN